MSKLRKYVSMSGRFYARKQLLKFPQREDIIADADIELADLVVNNVGYILQPIR